MDEITKSIHDNKALQKQHIADSFEKGKTKPIGTVTNGYKKVAEGKWVPVKKEENKVSSADGYKGREIEDIIDVYAKEVREAKDESARGKVLDKMRGIANNSNKSSAERAAAKHVSTDVSWEASSSPELTSPDEQSLAKLQKQRDELAGSTKIRDVQLRIFIDSRLNYYQARVKAEKSRAEKNKSENKDEADFKPELKQLFGDNIESLRVTKKHGLRGVIIYRNHKDGNKYPTNTLNAKYGKGKEVNSGGYDFIKWKSGGKTISILDPTKPDADGGAVRIDIY
jgi:hypothetical protein